VRPTEEPSISFFGVPFQVICLHRLLKTAEGSNFLAPFADIGKDNGFLKQSVRKLWLSRLFRGDGSTGVVGVSGNTAQEGATAWRKIAGL
jgi:hypothetical protein